MVQAVSRVAMVSMHTSPAAAPGVGDAGGMNVAILAVARQLSVRGIEVDLLTRATAEPMVESLADGVTLRTLAAGPAAPVPKAELSRYADEFGEAVATLVGRAAPLYDVLHSHYWLSGLSTLPVALELGLPLVQSFHTIGAMKNRQLAAGETPEPEQRVRTEAFLAMQADAIVAASSAEVSSIIDDLRAPADRVWVIPPGVDIDLFTPNRAAHEAAIRQKLGLEAGRPLLVVAGRIQPLKDQELAIRVVAEVHALRGPAPVLVIAGTAADVEYQTFLENVAADLGISADVRSVGALDRETLADLFAAASLTLVTSYSETFGLVAIESAASGTPVVAFRSSGLVDSVSNGESGVLIDSRDPKEWATVICGLLDDRARLSELSVSARAFAEGFTWATSAASLLAVYESLHAR
jgi:D-inositol-3-phosphate glycosyltransferase